MNLKKKFVVGAASVALIASMGGVAAPAAVAAPSLPGSIAKLARLGGLDRVQTSLEVAAHQFGEDHWTMNPKRLYVVSAAEGNMVDAATAGMLTDGPIVFVYNNSYVATAVGKDVAANIAGIKEVVAIGGDGVISDSTLNAVKDAMKVKKTSRLAGKDRYATSVAIADYLYTQSIKGDKSFANRTSGSGNFLMNAYLANGANEHVVDSMVAGTLDNGAILLTQPDGKIPEVVAEFIKKTLPHNFAALGGTGAVADATVNEAWVIKALANKWETSPGIPKIKMTVDELEWLVNGYSEEATGIDMSKKTLFGGLDRVVDVAGVNSSAWGNKVSGIKQKISNWFNQETNANSYAPAAYAAVLNDLKALYGDAVMAGVNASDAIALDKTEKYAVGVNYEGIEKSDAYKKAVKAASDDLEKMWSSVKQDPSLGSVLSNPVAKASQVHPDTAGVVTSADNSANNIPLVAVAAMAKYTLDTDKAWYDAKAKELAAAKGSLRGELDKINFKNELRLGGADRFETAQLIANHWARHNGGEFNLDENLYEAYIANGTRLADSLTAGQLTQGPIMLVRNETKIPDFTAAVAKNLLCWTNKTHPISVYGVGGTGVLSDEVLQAVVNLISTSSVCEVKGVEKPATSKLVASPNLTFHVGDTAAQNVTVDRTDTKVGPTMASGFPKVVDKDGTASTVFTVAAGSPATTTDGQGNTVNNYAVTPGAALAAADQKNAPYKVLFEDVDGNKSEIMIGIADALIDTMADQNATATASSTADYYSSDVTGARVTPISGVETAPGDLTIVGVTKGGAILSGSGITIEDIATPAPADNKFRIKFPKALTAGTYVIEVKDAKATGDTNALITVTVS